MPYVSGREALNLGRASLLEISESLGPGAWRKAIVGSPSCRVVLLHLPPGEEPHPPHRHPRADEVFLILQGLGAFTVGDAPEVLAGPLTVVYAPADVPHRIRVPGPEPLLWLSVVAPNLDAPDEAVEEAG
jgi:mannose-6-phosphate isomerase-like protein (cupin superfamily)